MEFILADKTDGCIFCKKKCQDNDRENYIVYRGTDGFIMLNAYPYTGGHLMVVPYAHVGTVEGLDVGAVTELMALVQRSVRALRLALHPEGFNIGMNIGKSAGAGIADHVHIHVVPRWQGDTNFMPVLADARTIPELLTDTYDRLVAAGIAATDDQI